MLLASATVWRQANAVQESITQEFLTMDLQSRLSLNLDRRTVGRGRRTSRRRRPRAQRQCHKVPSRSSRGPAEVPVEELMKKGDLPDLVLGSESAKVTMVEYASMTCGHCMAFATKVFPELQGQVHRHRQGALRVPRVPARCARLRGLRCWRAAPVPTKRFPLVEALFHTQAEWAFVKDQPDAEAVRDRQAGGLHAGIVRQVPDGPEAARAAHRHQDPR